ncbi:MAG: hypothetical protein AVDCRST_MAG17-539 [uncultured Solirubrobacterales bacterium]|uniref:Excalibur calcium-binding domain-containing protein n=1 Tax=uncultured Solirubrobacterales bacterium TaxID=768556 RepID=A0A6J4S6R3_9ACTN|nr:MAG: hypothetical protein AVDCRST_MAG17-539 [uncultured Solirubrobacterales bacterium]
MRRSKLALLFALMVALIASFALPVTASAQCAPGDAEYGGGIDGCEEEPSPGEPDSGSGPSGTSGSRTDGASNSSSGESGAGGSSSSRDDRDCSDFSSQSDAQSTYVNQDGDHDNLDADSDGSACEEFDYGDEFIEGDVTDASADEYPREGIASGGGSTASGGLSPLPLLVSAGGFALLAAGSGGVALRRRLGR